METKSYRMLLAGTASALAFAAGLPTMASAAEAPNSTTATLEEVTVTARRVAEDIQDVPLAITALSAEKLAQTDTKDFYTATKMVPGLTMSGQPGNGGTLTFTRGLPGTVGYFADVPRSPAGFATLFDVSSLQVLKGPQGTLFGLASNAGAIVIEPNRPGASFGGYVNASVGTYDRRSLEGAIDLPLLNDHVRLRLAAQSYYRKGYVTDISSGIDYGRQNYYIFRPSVIIKITDNIENYTLFQHYKQKNIAPGGNWGIPYDYNFSPTAQLPILAREQAVNGGTRAAFDALRDQILANQKRLGYYRFDGLSAGCPTAPTPTFGPPLITNLTYAPVACPEGSFGRDDLLVNTTTWSPHENLTIKNTFGYQWGETFSKGADQDSSRLIINDPNPRNNTPAKTDTTWSDELQISGKLFKRLDFVAGGFHNQTYNHPKIVYSSFSLGANNAATKSKISSYDWAIYAQGNYDLSDFVEGLVVTGGYRYSWDKVAQQSFGLNATTLAVTSMTGGPNSPAGHAKFSQGSYTLGVQYHVSPQTMLFFTNAKGYSSGGLQNVVGFEVFQPDSLNNFEAGVKSTFHIGGVTARINASAYYGLFDQVKVLTRILNTNAVTGIQTADTLTRNAGKAKIKGIESDMTFVLTPDLEVGGFLALAEDKFTSYPSINPITLQPIDLSKTGFTDIPKLKFGVRGVYHLPLDRATIGDVSAIATFTHSSHVMVNPRSETRTDPNNPNTGFICTRERTTANGYGPLSADGKKIYIDCGPPISNLDLAVEWRDVLGHDGLKASFTITNVTNNTDGFHTPTDAALGIETLSVPEPRMYALQLSYRF
jgi:iron complex outermembrane receptor protein